MVDAAACPLHIHGYCYCYFYCHGEVGLNTRRSTVTSVQLYASTLQPMLQALMSMATGVLMGTFVLDEAWPEVMHYYVASHNASHRASHSASPQCITQCITECIP